MIYAANQRQPLPLPEVAPVDAVSALKLNGAAVASGFANTSDGADAAAPSTAVGVLKEKMDVLEAATVLPSVAGAAAVAGAVNPPKTAEEAEAEPDMNVDLKALSAECCPMTNLEASALAAADETVGLKAEQEEEEEASASVASLTSSLARTVVGTEDDDDSEEDLSPNDDAEDDPDAAPVLWTKTKWRLRSQLHVSL